MKIVPCERKRGGGRNTFAEYRISKHTNISQKCFAVMLKSNCKLNQFNNKEGSGALSDSASQTSGQLTGRKVKGAVHIPHILPISCACFVTEADTKQSTTSYSTCEEHHKDHTWRGRGGNQFFPLSPPKAQSAVMKGYLCQSGQPEILTVQKFPFIHPNHPKRCKITYFQQTDLLEIQILPKQNS